MNPRLTVHQSTAGFIAALLLALIVVGLFLLGIHAL